MYGSAAGRAPPPAAVFHCTVSRLTCSMSGINQLRSGTIRERTPNTEISLGAEYSIVGAAASGSAEKLRGFGKRRAVGG